MRFEEILKGLEDLTVWKSGESQCKGRPRGGPLGALDLTESPLVAQKMNQADLGSSPAQHPS